MKIDYVFPWVNPLDTLWRNDYITTFGNANYDPARFRDLGLLRYVFRSIEVNAPWINKVFIILARPSQIPVWLNTDKVEVVFHDQFIPSEFLPLFNSAAIEQFLPNIPGISEYFIYGNDDFYFNSLTTENDFFLSDGIPKLQYDVKEELDTPFSHTCQNCFNLVKNDFQNKFLPNQFLKPFHGPTPMRMSTLKKVWELHSDEMLQKINIKRNVYTDLNQYIYTDYQVLSGQYHYNLTKCEYTQLNKDIFKVISLLKSDAKLLCVNDVESASLIDLPKIRGVFFEKFPKKSEFEL